MQTKFHVVHNNRPINWARTRKQANNIARDMESRHGLPRGTFRVYRLPAGKPR